MKREGINRVRISSGSGIISSDAIDSYNSTEEIDRHLYVLDEGTSYGEA